MVSPVLGHDLGSDLTKHLVRLDQKGKSIPSVIALQGGSLNCTMLPWEIQELGLLSYCPAYGVVCPSLLRDSTQQLGDPAQQGSCSSPPMTVGPHTLS